MGDQIVVIKVLHTSWMKLGAQEAHCMWRLQVADTYRASHAIRLLVRIARGSVQTGQVHGNNLLYRKSHIAFCHGNPFQTYLLAWRVLVQSTSRLYVTIHFPKFQSVL